MLTGQEVLWFAGINLGFAVGDFTFVSDGVVEACNVRGELFGFEQTREISTQPADVIAERAYGWGQNDDISVVTVRRADS